MRFARVTAVALFALSLCAATPSPDRQIWLAPQAGPAPLASSADFPAMFQPDAPWATAAAHTNVFKLYASYVNRAPQDQIGTIFADLKRRGIAVALEAGVMNVNFKPTPACGGLGLVEGYGTVAQADRISQKILAAGGRIDYLAMDEPLFYGHYFTRRAGRPQPGCHSSVQDVVRLSVPTIAEYRSAFPTVAVGDIEPTQIAAYSDGQNQLDAFASQFKAQTGQPLAFMHLDIPWANRPPSIEPADALNFYRYVQALQSQGLVGRIGIIYDGTPLDQTDADWISDAQRHIVLLTQTYGLHPNDAIFQSWMPNPTHAMPDGADQNTLTGLLDWYVSKR